MSPLQSLRAEKDSVRKSGATCLDFFVDIRKDLGEEDARPNRKGRDQFLPASLTVFNGSFEIGMEVH